MHTVSPIHIIGGGLAGAEAAWQAAEAGVPVVLHEMRPERLTAAHKTGGLAELVCSNSFRSDDWQNNAVGLLHEEMRRAGSLVMAAADLHKLPAGGALAVDRDAFSLEVSERLAKHPHVTLERGEIAGLPPPEWDSVIVATGPLTSDALAASILELTGTDALAFFDAIAPVIHAHSIDETKAWRQSRYDKAGPGGTGADYINCPLDKPQYEAFIDALLSGEKTSFKEWEANTPYFDGCLPIEIMAERGRDTLRFGPMKPVGLSNPHEGGRRPYAVVQLRQDNALGTLWNMVGFQTKLKHAEQVRCAAHDPGSRECGVRAARRPASQYISRQSAAARSVVAPEGGAAIALRRPDHRRRGLCRERSGRLARGAVRSIRAVRARAVVAAARRPHSARSSPTSQAAISWSVRPSGSG